MKPLADRTKLTHDPKYYGFDLIARLPTYEEVKRWGISSSYKNMNDCEVYDAILWNVNKYFEFDVPVGYQEDYKLSDDGFFTRDVITPERVAMVYMSLMRKESYENINQFLHDITVPKKGTFGVLPIYAKDKKNNPRLIKSTKCLAFGCTMISARADVLSDLDDCRHAAWSQEYCIELGVRAFALKVAAVMRGKRSNLLDAAVVAYHAWESEYSEDESLAWQDKYYTDIKALYLKYAPVKEGEQLNNDIGLKRGDRGEAVKRMQKALGGLIVDGIFGSNTENALKKYQENNGLSQTGILDSLTYSKLYEVSIKTRKIKISLDDGHGMDTNGGKWTPPLENDLYINDLLVRKKGERIKENEFNDAVCDILEISLARCGFNTFRSAPEEKDISLNERRKRIKNARCDFSISIHYNACGDGSSFNSGNGLSGKVDDDTPTQFAKDAVWQILKGINKIKGQRVRGVDDANLAMTNDDAMGCISCLIEGGFMTNRTEVKYMLDTEYQTAFAEAITKALCIMYDTKYIAPDESIEEPPANNTIDKEVIKKKILDAKAYSIEYVSEQYDSILEVLE